jgi:hypothetical protein
MSREAGCQGKEQLTPERAKQIAQVMNKRKKRDVAVSAYRCLQCKHWHVGGK